MQMVSRRLENRETWGTLGIYAGEVGPRPHAVGGKVFVSGVRAVKGKAHGAISQPPVLRKEPRRTGHPVFGVCHRKLGHPPPSRIRLRKGWAIPPSTRRPIILLNLRSSELTDQL